MCKRWRKEDGVVFAAFTSLRSRHSPPLRTSTGDAHAPRQTANGRNGREIREKEEWTQGSSPPAFVVIPPEHPLATCCIRNPCLRFVFVVLEKWAPQILWGERAIVIDKVREQNIKKGSQVKVESCAAMHDSALSPHSKLTADPVGGEFLMLCSSRVCFQQL